MELLPFRVAGVSVSNNSGSSSTVKRIVQWVVSGIPRQTLDEHVSTGRVGGTSPTTSPASSGGTSSSSTSWGHYSGLALVQSDRSAVKFWTVIFQSFFHLSFVVKIYITETLRFAGFSVVDNSGVTDCESIVCKEFGQTFCVCVPT